MLAVYPTIDEGSASVAMGKKRLTNCTPDEAVGVGDSVWLSPGGCVSSGVYGAVGQSRQD